MKIDKFNLDDGTYIRFKKTGSGNYKRKRAYLRHGMRKRKQDVKRNLRQKTLVSKADKQSVDLMLANI